MRVSKLVGIVSMFVIAFAVVGTANAGQAIDGAWHIYGVAPGANDYLNQDALSNAKVTWGNADPLTRPPTPTVVVHAGSYIWGNKFPWWFQYHVIPTNDSLYSSGMTIKSAGDGEVVVDGYLQVYQYSGDSAAPITVEGLTLVQRIWDQAVRIQGYGGTKNVTISDCLLESGGPGPAGEPRLIDLNWGPVGTRNVTISGCSLTNNLLDGIWMCCTSNDLLVEYSTFGGLRYGINGGGSGNLEVDHCTFNDVYVPIGNACLTSVILTNNLTTNNDNGYEIMCSGSVSLSCNAAYNNAWNLNNGDVFTDAEIHLLSAAPAYLSTTFGDVNFLALTCASPLAELVESACGLIGAKGLGEVCCIQGDEALLAACKAGRALVMATDKWNKPRNSGQGKGQGVKLNMPLIAQVASDYVDSLDICDPADADEVHSCIVSYFASGGKSSHFGE